MNSNIYIYVGAILIVVSLIMFRAAGTQEGFLTTVDSDMSAIPADARSAGDGLLRVGRIKRRFGDLLGNVRPASQSCTNPPNMPSVMVRLLKDAHWKEETEAARTEEAKRVLGGVKRQCTEVKLVEEIMALLKARGDDEHLTVTEFKGLTLELVRFQKRELGLDSDAINDIVGYPIADGTSGDDVNKSAGSDNTALDNLRGNVERVVKDAVAGIVRYSRSRVGGGGGGGAGEVEAYVPDVGAAFGDDRGLAGKMTIQTNDLGELEELGPDVVGRFRGEQDNLRGGNAIPLGDLVGTTGYGAEYAEPEGVTKTGFEVVETAGAIPMRKDIGERLRVQDLERQIQGRRRNVVNSLFRRVFG